VFESLLPVPSGRDVASDADAAGKGGWTALHRAVKRGETELVAQLLHDGADVEAVTDWQDSSPLHLAAAAGHSDLIPLLITPKTLDAKDAGHLTPLALAVRHNRLAAVTALVAAGASLGQPGAHYTPWRVALEALAPGSTADIALVLLDAMMADDSSAQILAAAVSWADSSGQTALHKAGASGSKELVERLLAAGADKDAVDAEGATPLWLAAAAGHAQLVPHLAGPGSINQPTREIDHWIRPGRVSPLLAAVEHGWRSAVEALLAAGAALDSCDQAGRNALGLAALRGHTPVVRLLLEGVARDCKKQKGQEQKAQARLVALVVVPAVVLLARKMHEYPACSQLLEVVLDVLGPEVTGEVCQAVQCKLQEEWDQPHLQPAAVGFWLRCSKSTHQHISHLAEALLLGWARSVERLQAARVPLVSRLQRLVVSSAKFADKHQYRQLRLQVQEAGSGEADSGNIFSHDWRHQSRADVQLQFLLAAAEREAAAGRQQVALGLLQEAAALLPLQQEAHDSTAESGSDWLRDGTASADSDPGDTPASAQPGRTDDLTPLAKDIYAGLMKSADERVYAARRAAGLDVLYLAIIADDPDPLQLAESFCPSGVYTTFLAAWVGARRQLQQVPQEMAAAVVAAVEVARQPQQQRQQQEEEQHQTDEEDGEGPAAFAAQGCGLMQVRCYIHLAAAVQRDLPAHTTLPWKWL
jgi:ankyrin repeat protein